MPKSRKQGMPDAREIIRNATLLEGGQVNLSIAQMGEAHRRLMEELAKLSREELVAHVQRYKSREVERRDAKR